jgi:hypothetical protein
MRQVTLLLVLTLGLWRMAPAQTDIDTFTVVPESGDTALFWAQIPGNYDSMHPPAILIWWHQLGGSQYEMHDFTNFDWLANQRGWIAASHFGYSDRHWNTQRAQAHCKAMMDWLMERYPFCRDSIYMIGGSMGGAAGQVWNNNNCGSLDDYMIAANAGASQILDTQLRQEQYLASGDTNRSMREDFGGLPSDSSAVAFQYHRASAVFFADTTQSMHFNSLNLPVYNTWGQNELEWLAYGFPAGWWDSLRRGDDALVTVSFCSGIPMHGLSDFNQDSVVEWLSRFSVDRYPKRLSINADESDEYYWTRVTLADTNHTFGRYGVIRDEGARRLDITLVHNISQIDIECRFPWPNWDSLSGHWVQLDSTGERGCTVRLCGIPSITSVRWGSEVPSLLQYNHDTLSAYIHGAADCILLFADDTSGPGHPVPARYALVSAYPNPFNSEISFEIESSGSAFRQLRFYDLLGRIALTKSVQLSPGTQRVNVSATGLASGIYFASLSGSSNAPIKIVLIR